MEILYITSGVGAVAGCGWNHLNADEVEVSSGHWNWKLSPPRCGERQRAGNHTPSHLDRCFLLRQTCIIRFGPVVKNRRYVAVPCVRVLACPLLEEEP